MKHFMNKLVIAGVLMYPTVVFTWDDSKAKPVAALELMEQNELAAQAQNACFDVCINRILHPTNSTETRGLLNQQQAALSYLDIVGLVARKKNGGKFPQWYKDMENIVRSTKPSNPSKCTDVYFRYFSRENERKGDK